MKRRNGPRLNELLDTILNLILQKLFMQGISNAKSMKMRYIIKILCRNGYLFTFKKLISK